MFRTSARKRALFRQVNERICDVSVGETYELICECDSTGCREHVVVPADVFDGAVRQGRRYLVAPGHNSPWETVLGRGPTYAVVA